MVLREEHVEDGLRRFRESFAEGKPCVTIFRCNAEAIAEEIAVLREQLTVATTRAQRFRDCLLQIAARADDYSGACLRAHVADALEMNVKELELRVEAQ